VEDILIHDREQLIRERKELQETVKKTKSELQLLAEEKEEREADWRAKETEWKRALIQRDAMYEKLASTPRRQVHAPINLRSKSFSLLSKLPLTPDLADSESGRASSSSSSSSSSQHEHGYTLASQLSEASTPTSRTGVTPTAKSKKDQLGNPTTSLSPSSPFPPPTRKAKDDLFLMT